MIKLDCINTKSAKKENLKCSEVKKWKYNAIPSDFKI